MMTPELDTDPTQLGTDGLIVLGINGMTSTVKEWIEDRIPDSLLPKVRRFYVLLPILCAGAICFMMDGCSIGMKTMACATKYGIGAAYLKNFHRAGVEGK